MKIQQQVRIRKHKDNDKNLKPSVEELENAYLYFLKDRCAVDKDFWKFIRDCLNISREELVKNVIWTNTFICSKRTEIGHPIPTKELKVFDKVVDNLSYSVICVVETQLDKKSAFYKHYKNKLEYVEEFADKSVKAKAKSFLKTKDIYI